MNFEKASMYKGLLKQFEFTSIGSWKYIFVKTVVVVLKLISYPANPTYKQRKSQQQITTKKKKSKCETYHLKPTGST